MNKRPFFAAFTDASDGLYHAFVAQPNFRIQLGLGLVAVVVAALLRFDATSWAILVLAIGFVLAAELFNTCLEHLVDLIQPDAHPLARSAKHAGAAAVLAASIAAAVIGAIVYGQALAHVLSRRG